MATSGELARVIAQSFNLPEVTVANCYRALREANLVPKAGRGPRSGAPMTSETAAKLIIALCGSQHEKEPPPKVVANFDGLAAHWAEFKDEGMLDRAECEPSFRLVGYSLPCLEALQPGHSFLEGLAALIETAARGEFPFEQRGELRIPNRVTIGVEINAAPTRRATIEVMITRPGGGYIAATVEYRHVDDQKRDREELLAFLVNADLEITRKFRVPTIIALGELLKTSEFLSPVGQSIADKLDLITRAMEQKTQAVMQAGSPEDKVKLREELRAIMKTFDELSEGLGDEK